MEDGWALILADMLVLAHLLFVAFVMTGGFLLARWPRLLVLHLPAVAWGAYIELSGGICPLTPLENHLRALGAARPTAAISSSVTCCRSCIPNT